MLTKKSLHMTMNEVSARMDSHRPYDRCDILPAISLSEEISAYFRVDPLLAELVKQKEEDKAHFQKLRARYGDDDPMVAVALDMIDSTESAIQTRLIELRRDHPLTLQTKKILSDYHERLIQRKKQKKEERWYYLRRMHRQIAEKARKAGEENFFTAVYMIWIVKQMFKSTQDNLSAAQSFSTASDPENTNSSQN